MARKYKRGFTIVELLISLAITAILLTSIAIAFNASVISYNQNQKLYQVLNNARGALSRITTQLRTAQAVDPDTSENECSLITVDGEDITYRFDGSNDTLYLITNDDLSDSDYVLCDNVTSVVFKKQTAVNGGITYVKDVRISITTQIDNVSKDLCAAAVIRKNMN